jgi:lipoyl(octanoyl) transferase
LFSELTVHDDPTPRTGPLNMAIDEALLRTTSAPLLRFYRWREASVSFGYFGKFEKAKEFAGVRHMVRRWTGGGTVPHGEDLTYSLIIPAADPASNLFSKQIYRAVHEAIAGSFRLAGIETVLAQESAPKENDSCFANPVVADVIEAGRKIAGAAHRKTRAGLLHQGSVQRDHLARSFRQRLACALSDRINEEPMSGSVLEAAEKLAAEKYATETWLRRR